MAISLIAGSNGTCLSENIASILKCGLVAVERKRFPDKDQYVRLSPSSGIKGAQAFVVGSTWPDQDSSLFEMMLLADAARKSGASEVCAAIPYLSYSRQDRKFLDGEPVSLDVVLSALKSAGVSSLITVDSHFMRSAGRTERCGLDITNLSAYPVLMEKATSMVKRPVIIAPDLSMEAPLKKFGEVLVIEKSRDRTTGKVSAADRLYPVEGADVIFVDDMITAGGTMIKAAAILSRSKPSSMSACCAHGLFVDGADKRMKEAGITTIVSTDTIESKYSAVSVAPIIAEAICGT